jgi:hypothetical protein
VTAVATDNAIFNLFGTFPTGEEDPNARCPFVAVLNHMLSDLEAHVAQELI